MSRTITALFDTREDAEAGGERLRQAGVDAAHVAVHDQSTHQTADAYSTRKDQGLWASIKHAVLPDEDRHTYEEGIRRGGFLLTAEVDDDKTPDAVRALEAANSVDLDARAQEWRSDGWDYAGVDAIDDDLADDPIPRSLRDYDQGSERFRSYYRSEPGRD